MLGLFQEMLLEWCQHQWTGRVMPWLVNVTRSRVGVETTSMLIAAVPLFWKVSPLAWAMHG